MLKHLDGCQKDSGVGHEFVKFWSDEGAAFDYRDVLFGHEDHPITQAGHIAGLSCGEAARDTPFLVEISSAVNGNSLDLVCGPVGIVPITAAADVLLDFITARLACTFSPLMAPGVFIGDGHFMFCTEWAKVAIGFFVGN